jgi:Mg-chelatase subunit ChlD
MIFRNPTALYLLGLLVVFFAIWLWRRERVPFTAMLLRLLIVAGLIGAAADPAIVQSVQPGQTLVLLVDQSDSLGEAGRVQLRARAEQLARDAQQTSATVTVRTLNFGAQVAALGSTPRTDQSDLASAMQTARQLIGNGGGRVVLLSDGVQTRGNLLAEAQQFASRQIPVDTVAYVRPEQPEIWIEQIQVQPTLRVGESYTVRSVISATTAAGVRVQLFDGDTVLQGRDEELQVGTNVISFTQRAIRPGIARLRLSVSGQPDTIERNNSASATALIAPPPRVLIVEGRGGQGTALRESLRLEGIESDQVDTRTVPAQLSPLQAYDGVVLVDVPASELTLDQMSTLREFVRSEGRGLVAVGGRTSMTLGSYKDTPLEQVLPVKMEPPPRPERGEVTLLLIVDRSASMGVPDRPSKLDMAKEAAILAIEELRQNDRIGVLTFDTETEWAVNFQPIGAGLTTVQIQDQISQVGLGGGTDIFEALSTGLGELERQPGQIRHVVLLTDGRSFTSGRLQYRNLLDRARAQQITVSSIAIGEDSDIRLLQDIADWGAGRYHFAGSAEDIPRLTLLESEIARGEPQIEGNFRAEQQAPHPVLRELSASQMPELNGYVGTQIKPEAELVLQSPDDDPVLAVWQYGLGRAVAWTPTIAEPWAADWPAWPQYNLFWSQMVRYTLPEPDSGPLRVRVTTRNDVTTIHVDSLSPSGAPVDLADTEAAVTLPDGTVRALALRQVGPGRYEQQLSLPTDGPYAIDVQQSKREPQEIIERTASVGHSIQYPGEYRPTSSNLALLTEVSALTDGRVLAEQGGVGLNPVEAPLAGGSVDLWPWLMLAALLLWPLEIIVRRGWLRRQG